MDLKKTAVNVEAEDEGEWKHLYELDQDGSPPARVLVRSLQSPEVRRRIVYYTRRAKRTRGGMLDPIESDLITARAVADVGILDWEGIEEDGHEIKFSRDEAHRLMTDRTYRRFALAVTQAMIEVGDDELTDREGLLGKSHTTSGDSSG